MTIDPAFATLWAELCAGFVLASCLVGLLSGLLEDRAFGWALDRMANYSLRSLYILLCANTLAGLGWIVFYL